METKVQYTACTISVKHCGCFDVLSKEEKELMDKNSVLVSYKRGEIICKQGAFVSNIMMVESGLAKVFMESNSSKLIIKIVPDGNFIGLASISDDNNTSYYSATAYVDSVVRQIELDFFRELLEKNSAFALKIINILGANTLQVYGRFFCLSQKQAYGRLADIILCLADRVFKTNEFDLPLSRRDLGELSGMSPETVIRKLNKFMEEGLIEMKGKKFRVLNYERLSQISEKG
jgi:CRP/FNR family transcriptional regulator